MSVFEEIEAAAKTLVIMHPLWTVPKLADALQKQFRFYISYIDAKHLIRKFQKVCEEQALTPQKPVCRDCGADMLPGETICAGCQTGLLPEPGEKTSPEGS